ncbi:hypothetical protein C8Q77DRAFT_1161217 [Trametes polyzona]|nr:hypothetical protein C8Q77DRAFT_1161217 [Trametes polyzona]
MPFEGRIKSESLYVDDALHADDGVHLDANEHPIHPIIQHRAEFAQDLSAYLGVIQSGVDALLKFLIYVFAHYPWFIYWLEVNFVVRRRSLPAIVGRTGCQALSQCIQASMYYLAVAYKFLFPPWRTPEDHARKAFKAHRRVVYGPIEEHKMRVEWFPNEEAANRWPDGLGKLWTDLPLDADDNLDLSPLKRLWGMDNCYVLLPAPGPRMRVGRHPDEKLTPLAWMVASTGGTSVCVMERPTPTTAAARQARAFVKRVLHADITLREISYPLTHLVLPALSLLFWMAVTLSAVGVFFASRVYQLGVAALPDNSRERFRAKVSRIKARVEAVVLPVAVPVMVFVAQMAIILSIKFYDDLRWWVTQRRWEAKMWAKGQAPPNCRRPWVVTQVVADILARVIAKVEARMSQPPPKRRGGRPVSRS